MTDKREKVLMVCVGDRVSTRDTLIQGWAEVGPDGRLVMQEAGEAELVRFWSKPLARHAGAGSVYEVHVVRTGKSFEAVTTGDDAPRYLEAWHDRDAVLGWRALHSQAHEAVESVRAEKRAKADDPIAAEVERLREIVHRQTSYRKRAALISAIAAELHRPPARGKR